MDTTYCDNCGLLHDPEDGECLGCVLMNNVKILRGAIVRIYDMANSTRYGGGIQDTVRKALKDVGSEGDLDGL